MNALSLVIPAFTGGEHLRFALNSVSAAPRSFDEVVIVNANPNNLMLKRELAEWRTPSMRVINSMKTLGPSEALNLGWESCSGEYVAFLDEDNWLDPLAVEALVATMQGSRQIYFVSCHPTMLERRVGGEPVETHIPFCGDDLGHFSIEHTIASHLKVISRTALVSSGGFDPAYDGCEDWELFLRLAGRKSWKHVNKTLDNHCDLRQQINLLQDSDVRRRVGGIRGLRLGTSVLVKEKDIGNMRLVLRCLMDSDELIDLKSLLLISAHGSQFQVTHFTLPRLQVLLTSKGCNWVMLCGSARPELGPISNILESAKGTRPPFVLGLTKYWIEAHVWAKWYVAYLDLIIVDPLAETLMACASEGITPMSRVW